MRNVNAAGTLTHQLPIGRNNMSQRPVIIDTDPGIDDAMAIAFAAESPDLEIVALTTVTGNASIAQTTSNALALRTRFGFDAAIARGAGSALDGRTPAYPDLVHGSDGLGNTERSAATGELDADDAATLIVNSARRFAGRLNVVALGQLTNLARALRLAPELPQLVERVVIMGGAVGTGEHRGNVTPVAEANIHGDPLAADIVLNAGWPVTLVGLDVTMQTIMGPADRARLATGGSMGRYLHDISAFYADFYRQRYGIDGFPVHDSSAIACLLDPSLFTTERGCVRVVSGGAAHGMTVFVPESAVVDESAWSDNALIDVCTGVDARRLINGYLDVVLAAP